MTECHFRHFYRIVTNKNHGNIQGIVSKNSFTKN